MKITAELVFETFENQNEFLEEGGTVINPVEYLIDSFYAMPRDYVNFDVYEKKEE